jgi:hypothetical protein
MGSHTGNHSGNQKVSRLRLFTITTLLLALVAGPAMATIFTITLKNGTVFESRYRPAEADWDTTQLTFLTDWGNWMSIPKDDVDSILSEIEGRGFGTQIDTTTIAFGWDPGLTEEETDRLLAVDGEEGEGGPGQGNEAMVQAFQDMGNAIERSRQVPDFSMDQFVEPDRTQGQPMPGVWGNTGGGGDYDDQ